MPFLASKGYDTYSISLRGTSGTPFPGPEVRKAVGGCKLSGGLVGCASSLFVFGGRRALAVSLGMSASSLKMAASRR